MCSVNACTLSIRYDEAKQNAENCETRTAALKKLGNGHQIFDTPYQIIW